MREKIINEIYFNNYEDIKDQIEDYNLPYDKNYYITCVIEPDTEKDIKLNLLTIKDILKNFFAIDSNMIQSINNNNMILTFYYSNKGKESIEKTLI